MPSLDEVRRLVSESGPSDWNVVHAPLYDNTMGAVESGQPSGETVHWVDVDNHFLVGVFKADVRLRVAYGLRTRDSEDWQPDWARFANPIVNAYYADVFWNGSLIDRCVVLAVDGGRATLPDPRGFYVNATGDLMDSEHVADTVTKWQVAMARTVHHFERSSSQDFDSYLERSGFIVVES